MLTKTCKENLIDSDLIFDTLNGLETRLKAKIPTGTISNITHKELNTAALEFLYLFSCSEMSRAWTLFYQDLFERKAPDQILLTLNRILKGRRTLIKNDMENIAENIFQEFKSSILNANGRQNSRSGISLTSKKYINHPVHIINEKKKFSPSAFIPFCEFGGIMTAMGVKIEGFHIPVCSTFQAKIFNDQLCYEVDLNKYSDKNNIEKQLQAGFYFLMDYNEDRQVTFDHIIGEEREFNLATSLANADHHNQASIYLNTVGKIN